MSNHFALDEFKRNAVRLCKAVDADGFSVGGSETLPLMYLYAAGELMQREQDHEISVEQLKADFSNIHIAVTVLGVRFHIFSKKTPLAILVRNEDVKHGALRYAQPPTPENALTGVQKSLDDIREDIRMLAKQIERQSNG
ncbi:hypothetical protein EVC12_020 [Rhizobium phage RHph_I42]|nr:hypothetical protein EVC12_020 [Rhizobium phage RHph_I42]